jgi:hypothetical protein
MAEERLTGSAILSIENDVASALRCSEILGSFSSREGRERYFYTVTPMMLQNTWKEVEYRLDICRAAMGAHVEIY